VMRLTAVGRVAAVLALLLLLDCADRIGSSHCEVDCPLPVEGTAVRGDDGSSQTKGDPALCPTAATDDSASVDRTGTTTPSSPSPVPPFPSRSCQAFPMQQLGCGYGAAVHAATCTVGGEQRHCESSTTASTPSQAQVAPPSLDQADVDSPALAPFLAQLMPMDLPLSTTHWSAQDLIHGNMYVPVP
jgi:hypothetical protein